MQKKRFIGLVILLLLLAGWIFINRKTSYFTDNESFSRNPEKLVYTRHARCRMDCRRITKEEVLDILKNGKLNPGKSDPHDRPCPSFALEGYTRQDGQHVRIVFARCGDLTKVITCIDLDREFSCNCN